MRMVGKCIVVACVLFSSALLAPPMRAEAKKAKLVDLKEGKEYSSYDIDGDSQKDRICIKYTKEYGVDNWFETQCIITVNDSETIVADGYKGVNVKLFVYGKKAAIVYEDVAGTGARGAVIINYENGEFKKKNIWWNGGWETYFSEGKASLSVVSRVKGAWWLKSFEKFKNNYYVPFLLESNYAFKGNQLVRKTRFRNVKGVEKYSVRKNIKTGKTRKSISKKNGFTLKKGSQFVLKQVYYNKNNSTYYYKIKYKTHYGWIKDSSKNRFYPANS